MRIKEPEARSKKKGPGAKSQGKEQGDRSQKRSKEQRAKFNKEEGFRRRSKEPGVKASKKATEGSFEWQSKHMALCNSIHYTRKCTRANFSQNLLQL